MVPQKGMGWFRRRLHTRVLRSPEAWEPFMFDGLDDLALPVLQNNAVGRGRPDLGKRAQLLVREAHLYSVE